MYIKSNKIKNLSYKKKKITKKNKLIQTKILKKQSKIFKDIHKKKSKKMKCVKCTHKGGGIFYDNKFLDCYDDNLQKIQNAINKFSGKHSINQIIANEFIENQISPVRKQAARDLVENTIYITLSDISEIIEKLVIKLYTENSLNTEDNIYIYSGKTNKSFYFIAVLMLYYIRKNNFKEPTHFISELNNELFDTIGSNPLLIIDDVAYSGNQLSTILNNIYYNRTIVNKKSPPNIYVIITALNDFSKEKLMNVPIKKTKSGIILDYTRSPFKLVYLAERLYVPLIKQLGIERYFYLNLFFSPYTESTPYVSLYLDHKIADEASTYKNALLYGPIIPSNYNYQDYLTNIDYLYELIPSNNLFKQGELMILINDFNYFNNTNFKSFNSSIIKILSDKLKTTDIFTDSQMTLRFKPFINNCNKNNLLLDNISDQNILNYDYRLFSVPKGCLKNDDDCTITNEYILEYINDIMSSDQISNINIHNKINNFVCPISWYKKGEFMMSC